MKNALLCFLKYPEPGHVKTRLAEDLDEQSAASLYEAMAERVIAEVYPLDGNYDLFLWVDPKHDLDQYRTWIGDSWQYREQRGGDLGERLSYAFTHAFTIGYDRVAVIGTDCIGMDQTFIEETFAKLEEHDFVVGPSTDGGYYLLGASQNSPWLFQRVPWSTDEVLEITLDKIDVRDLTVAQLEEKIDVDDLDALVRFKDSLPEEHFLSKKIDHMIMDRVTLPAEAEKLFED